MVSTSLVTAFRFKSYGMSIKTLFLIATLLVCDFFKFENQLFVDLNIQGNSS